MKISRLVYNHSQKMFRLPSKLHVEFFRLLHTRSVTHIRCYRLLLLSNITTDGDLVVFIQEIVDSFKYIAVRKNISLHFVSAFSHYNTTFDKEKLERILINLLSNAIKFTNDGGNVSLQITADGDAGIKMILRDTGIGLPANVRDKIFERFFQVNNNVDILNQGSGIGLSIAQEFVKLHGGTIKVESEEGVGSAFTITLPLAPISFQPSTPSLHTDKEVNSIEGFAKKSPQNWRNL